MAITKIANTTLSRVFLTQSKSSPAVAPEFQDCLVVGGVSRDYGDKEPVYCQSPYEIGKFRKIDSIESAPSDVESSLNGRFSLDSRSTLIAIAEAQAPVDMHAHLFNKGDNPSVFNDWQQKLIFEGVEISSLSIDDLGSHDENTAVNHSIDFSASAWYQVVPLTFSERATSYIDKEMLGAFVHYNGKLEKPPRERYQIFTTSIAQGGSASTPPDIVYSLDQGATWIAMDVNSATSSDSADAVAVVGQYVAVLSASTDSIHYCALTEFDGVTVPQFTEVSTGFTASKGPLAISVSGSLAFIAAEGGYVYRTSYIPNGVEAMTAGTVVTEDLNAISAYDENTIVAVGDSNSVIVCLDGENFAAVSGPEAGADMTSVAALSPTVFLVGTGGGKLWYTTDAGVRWTQKSFPSSGSGVVEDIKFASSMVGYMSHTLSGAGRILMTTDAGYSWVLVPSGGLAAYADKFNALAVAPGNVNLLVAAGLADDGTDGTVFVAEPA